jgi:agmatine deiminase
MYQAMITDDQTNFLFLADCLPKRFPEFYRRLEQTLREQSIPFSLLPHTKDVWAVDYMPLQVTKDRFVQFIYNPDYLQSKMERNTISDTTAICAYLGLATTKSNIVLDGGNVVRAANKAIVCEKVFKENPAYSTAGLEQALKEWLWVEELIFVPRQPGDFTGHADGMVRFVDKHTVLLNDYAGESKRFQRAFHQALDRAGLTCVELPYNPYGNKTYWDATGCYINYLHMQQAVVVPQFGLTQDAAALQQLTSLFPAPVVALDCREVARQGGVLNCISWNVLV